MGCCASAQVGPFGDPTRDLDVSMGSGRLARLASEGDVDEMRDDEVRAYAKAMQDKLRGGKRQSPVDKLADAQLEQFQEAFQAFDKDGGGSIDSSELGELMATVGQNPSPEELKLMIAAADADGTGDIDFVEFAVLMAHRMQMQDSPQLLKAAFRLFDTSGDGLISAHEMRRLMINLGEQVTAQDIACAVASCDQNGDGMIDMHEFRDVLLGRTSLTAAAPAPAPDPMADDNGASAAPSTSDEPAEAEAAGAWEAAAASAPAEEEALPLWRSSLQRLAQFGKSLLPERFLGKRAESADAAAASGGKGGGGEGGGEGGGGKDSEGGGAAAAGAAETAAAAPAAASEVVAVVAAAAPSPDVAAPDAAGPEEAAEASASEPEAATPEAAAPEAAIPESAVPESAAPESAASEAVAAAPEAVARVEPVSPMGAAADEAPELAASAEAMLVTELAPGPEAEEAPPASEPAAEEAPPEPAAEGPAIGGEIRHDGGGAVPRVEVPVPAEPHSRVEELFAAVDESDVNKLAELLDAGVPASSVDGECNTALIKACERASEWTECARVLLARGCAVDHQNAEGRTALMVAVVSEGVELVSILLGAKANTELKNAKGESALDLAAGNEEVRGLLTGETTEA